MPVNNQKELKKPRGYYEYVLEKTDGVLLEIQPASTVNRYSQQEKRNIVVLIVWLITIIIWVELNKRKTMILGHNYRVYRIWYQYAYQ